MSRWSLACRRRPWGALELFAPCLCHCTLGKAFPAPPWGAAWSRVAGAFLHVSAAAHNAPTPPASLLWTLLLRGSGELDCTGQKQAKLASVPRHQCGVSGRGPARCRRRSLQRRPFAKPTQLRTVPHACCCGGHKVVHLARAAFGGHACRGLHARLPRLPAGAAPRARKTRACIRHNGAPQGCGRHRQPSGMLCYGRQTWA